ncbi:hypothetical protein GJ496_000836 [Pomphorhynchus laevis]|nr:hypothetical protein GJ496_000836 [Pomphorhynchus laevis]
MLNRESSIIYPGKSHRLLEKMNDDETIDRIKSIADQLQFVTNDIKKQYFPLAKVLTSQQFITNQNIFVEMAVLRVLIQFSRLYRLKTAWITVPIEKLYQLILNCVKYIFSTEISLTTDQTAILKRVKRGNIYSLFDISSYPWKYNEYKLNYKIDKESMKRILCKFNANLNAISFEIKNKELLKSLYESSISSNGDIRLRICTAIIDAITSNNELYESSNLLTILKQRSYDVDVEFSIKDL